MERKIDIWKVHKELDSYESMLREHISAHLQQMGESLHLSSKEPGTPIGPDELMLLQISGLDAELKTLREELAVMYEEVERVARTRTNLRTGWDGMCICDCGVNLLPSLLQGLPGSICPSCFCEMIREERDT